MLHRTIQGSQGDWGDAETLDIFTSLRLHPTFYVGRLKQYLPATLHGLAPMMGSEARKSASHPVLLDAPMTSDAAAFPSLHSYEPGIPGSSSIRVAPGSTDGSHSQSSPPVQHAREPPRLPAERQQPCSQHRQHRPGQPGRQRYLHERPPPLVDAEGQVRWIVDHIVDHRDPSTAAASSAHVTRAVPTALHYRIRWLGIPPEQDSWEPRSSLFCEVPDVVRDYESMLSGRTDVNTGVNVLVVNETARRTLT